YITFARVDKPGSFVTASETAFAKDFAVSEACRTMEMRRLLTSGPGADGQGGTDVVRIANRIGHGQEADVLDIVSRKEAKVRGVRSIWNSVKDIGHKDIIDIHTDVGKRSAHHAELSVKIIVRGRRDAGEGLKKIGRAACRERVCVGQVAAC